jgi:membrane-associated phospholipid phosphatase
VGAEGRMGRRVALATWLVVAGVAAFAGAAAALRLGPPAWDPSLFAALNEVGVAWERILRPLASLASPVGLTIVAVLAATLVTVRNRSAVPLASCAVAGSGAWLVANLAKLIVDRPRPYETMVEAVLRQDPARGTSFPSSHTAVTVAVAIALLPFVSKPWRAAAVVFAVLVGWSRVYLGVHYPLDVLGGAGIGLAVGGATWLVPGRWAPERWRNGARREVSPEAEPDP